MEAQHASSGERVADKLHSASIHLLRRVARQDVASGVGPAQLSALSVLVFGGPMTLTELAAAERVRPPTMTRVVNALEQAGLARKQASAGDRRSITITPTRRGEHVLARARKNRLDELTRRLHRVSAADLRTLERAAELMEEVAR